MRAVKSFPIRSGGIFSRRQCIRVGAVIHFACGAKFADESAGDCKLELLHRKLVVANDFSPFLDRFESICARMPT